MNLAALTAFAHCGYYAAMLAVCSWQTSRLISHNDDDAFSSEGLQMMIFGTFSVIYLYALASANIYQLRAFWKEKAAKTLT